MSMWIRDNEVLLEQGVTVFTSLSDSAYRTKPNGSNASPGEHMRHIIEHYQLFLEGIEVGNIDYDKRKRDKSIATNRDLALESLQKLVIVFETKEFPKGPILISQNYNSELTTPVVTSSIERELLFLISHTIHHYALIELALNELGIMVPVSFGYSPATLYANIKTNQG